MGSRKKKAGYQWIFYTIGVLLLLGATSFWYMVLKPNYNADAPYFYIRTGETFEDVEAHLATQLQSLKSFHLVALKMEYDRMVKPGRYKLHDGMNNRELISLLRSGKQEPVKLVVRTYWEPAELAHVICRNLEADSLGFLQDFTDSALLAPYGFTPQTAMGMALPNTYYMNWSAPKDSIVARLAHEFRKFWTPEREVLVAKSGLSKQETVILASIVWREIAHADEMERVAGVYLNRLRKGTLLQADPTVKFAMRDFKLRRILNIHLATESPYNTYIHKGLPPGPICNPPASAIDAVLHAEPHDYIYFCAQPGNTGYHNFARTLTEHNQNARLFHTYLNSLRRSH